MAQLISLLLLAFAVSLDSFSVGFTYGLKKMKIPLKSIAVLACCSAVTLLAAMGIGHFFENLIKPDVSESIGGIILIFLGGWVLFQFFRPEKLKDVLPGEKTIANFEIKSLGIVINILRKPMSADFDRSGTITGIEAFMLGLALSLDAFGAGVGAAMLGYSPVFLAVTVAVMSSLFVYVGMKTGALFSNSTWLQKFTFIPGVLLIFIGISKM
ncbi:integral inner membrane protein [Bacillus methanolicus PB1]|uniref:Integral inner membrane protein n=1 Tax=Bacillus methanolicus PB1 TaxID=997296 RepID=I3DYA4_BACMT|nr:sporulation membrane protein YtaF [Bacillus methanolicus]EIJ79225.1 integral inner membrane protein [Bacillus methanolicus PB1]